MTNYVFQEARNKSADQAMECKADMQTRCSFKKWTCYPELRIIGCNNAYNTMRGITKNEVEKRLTPII